MHRSKCKLYKNYFSLTDSNNFPLSVVAMYSDVSQRTYWAVAYHTYILSRTVRRRKLELIRYVTYENSHNTSTKEYLSCRKRSMHDNVNRSLYWQGMLLWIELCKDLQWSAHILFVGLSYSLFDPPTLIMGISGNSKFQKDTVLLFHCYPFISSHFPGISSSLQQTTICLNQTHHIIFNIFYFIAARDKNIKKTGTGSFRL